MPELLNLTLSILAGIVIAAEIFVGLLVLYQVLLTLAAIYIWLTRPAHRLPRNIETMMSRGGTAVTPPRQTAPADEPQTRFDVLIPAHNEELLITRVVQSLLGIDYPRDLFRVHVIADNCDDSTPDLARAAGAIVHVRNDQQHRGKGYALRWLFAQLLASNNPGDAFVIVDADSVVNRDFLRALDARLKAGAVAMQSYDTVLNVSASWSTALRYIAFSLLHYLRPLGRKLFGGSAGLKGNGMCFRRNVLAEMNWDAFSVTEDLQFHLNLLLKGYIVEFVPQAIVWSDMPENLRVAQAQNERWESGRLELLQRYVPSMLREGLKRRSLPIVDAAMDNIVPPFSIGFALVIILLILALISGSTVAIALGLFSLVGLIFYTLVGLLLVRAPGKVFLALVYAPFYVVWKVAMWLPLALGRRNRATEWTRTERGTPAQID